MTLQLKENAMNRKEQRIWLITGVSGGLGKALALEAAQEGDFVIGTVKKEADAFAFEQELGANGKAVILDLLQRERMPIIIDQIIQDYEKVDVLVNNAGYGLIGFTEEANPGEIQKQMEVNFFAPLQLTQLLLPYMRARLSGHIIQISSRLGIVSAPGFGLYAASKFALEGASEALAAEVAQFNIKLTMVEPGPLRTEFFGRSPVFTTKEIEAYHAALGNIKETSRQRHGKQDGDPLKVARAIVLITKMEKPPLRLPLTVATVGALQQKIREYQSILHQWEGLALNTKIDSEVIEG